jgi:phage-related protein
MRKPERRSRAGDAKQIGLPPVRPIAWVGGSKDDLSAMPREVKASFGSRLFEL